MTNNKELFMKWIQILFYVQCAVLVITLIAKLPFVGSWFSWVIRLTTIATIFVLYKLSLVNARYLKAAIFMGVTLLTTVFLRGLGHSEMMEEVDARLSKNWRSLFNWELWGGFLIGGITVPIVVAIVLAGPANVELATGVTQVFTDGFSIILNIVYLVLLKRMLTAYASYEPQVEDVGSEDI